MSDVSLLTGRTATSELRVVSLQSGPLSLPLGVDRPGDCQRRRTEVRHEGANVSSWSVFRFATTTDVTERRI